MEKLSAFVEKLATQKRGVDRMSDVSIARGIMDDYVKARGAGERGIIDRFYESIKAHLPPKAANKWTRRRVKGMWAKEARIVEFGEMLELYLVLEKEKEVQAQRKRDRQRHAEEISKITSISTLLESQDPDFHGPQIEVLRSYARDTGQSED